MTQHKKKLLQQRPELIERYIRLRMASTGRRWGRNLARRISRRRLLKEEAKKAKALNPLLLTVSREIVEFRRNLTHLAQ